MDALKELKWGSFGPVHIITLILSALIVVALYFILKGKTEKTQKIVLFLLSLWGPAAIIYNILMWGLKSTVLEYLPFHLCSINAILLPILVLTKSNVLGNLLPVYSVGAVLALILNTFQADYLIFDHVFLMFWLPHTLEFAIPILMIALGLIKIRPKYIPACLGITFVMYTVIHFINLWLNQYLIDSNILDSAGNVIQVSYMYSLYELGGKGNPMFDIFYSLIPYDYFYMLAAFPIIGVVYFFMNLKYIISTYKQKKAQK